MRRRVQAEGEGNSSASVGVKKNRAELENHSPPGACHQQGAKTKMSKELLRSEVRSEPPSQDELEPLRLHARSLQDLELKTASAHAWLLPSVAQVCAAGTMLSSNVDHHVFTDRLQAEQIKCIKQIKLDTEKTVPLGKELTCPLDSAPHSRADIFPWDFPPACILGC